MNNESITPSPYRVKNKDYILFGIGGLFVLDSFMSWLTAPYPTAYGLSSILVSVALLTAGIVWCHMDAAERGIPLGNGFRLFAVFLFVVALPYYLIKSRGLKRALWSFVKIAGFLLAMIVVVTVVQILLALIDDRTGLFLITD